MKINKLKEDKKLDNNRVPINLILVELSYNPKGNIIAEKKRKFNTRSGYCVDSKDGGLSVSFSDIGKIIVGNGFKVTTYLEDVDKAKESMNRLLVAVKKDLLAQAKAVPFFIKEKKLHPKK